MSETQYGMSRRTLAKGVAWATPAVAVAAAAPAYAASLPECIQSIQAAALQWPVDNAEYPGCSSCGAHMDVRMQITVKENCNQKVAIRVSNVAGNSMWCAWTTTVRSIIKTIQVSDTIKMREFPAAGDVIPGPAGCTIVAHTNGAINDGMHVNPCTSGYYFMYELSFDDGPWQGPYYWGTRDVVGVPPACSPQPVPVITKNASCETTVSWAAVPNASSYQVQYNTNATGNQGWSGWTTVNGTSYTFPQTGIRRVRVRVGSSGNGTMVTWNPPAVTGVTATRSGNTYTVNWDAIPGGSFSVDKSTNTSCTRWTSNSVGTPGATGTTFTDSNTRNCVRVRANVCGVNTDWVTVPVSQARGTSPGDGDLDLVDPPANDASGNTEPDPLTDQDASKVSSGDAASEVEGTWAGSGVEGSGTGTDGVSEAD